MTVLESAFGNIFVASELENAVISILETWFPTYLREVERQVGWGLQPLPHPVSYSNRTTFDVQPGEAMPKAVVISPGLFEAPVKGDAGEFYNSTWQVAVGVAMAANTEEQADEQCKMYGAAVRAMLIQHQSLDKEGITGVHWLDESYDDLQIPNKIGLFKATASLFAVTVENVVKRWAGPLKPIETPQLEEEVLTASATITKHPILDEL